jgi:hypothetical protein
MKDPLSDLPTRTVEQFGFIQQLAKTLKWNRCYELDLMTNSDFTVLQHRFTSQSISHSTPPNYKALSSMILNYEEDFNVAPLVQCGWEDNGFTLQIKVHS